MWRSNKTDNAEEPAIHDLCSGGWVLADRCKHTAPRAERGHLAGAGERRRCREARTAPEDNLAAWLKTLNPMSSDPATPLQGIDSLK